MGIKKIMEAVLRTVDHNNQRILIQHNGHLIKAISTVNPPADEMDIAHFEKQIGYHLPKDHHSFLLEYDGAHIYQMILDSGVNGGGGLKLYSIQEMKENLYYMEVYPGFLPIGEVDQQYLTISLEAIQIKDVNYLYRIDYIEEPHALNLNLHLFLDRFVVAQGLQFWDWPIYSAASRYYLEED